MRDELASSWRATRLDAGAAMVEYCRMWSDVTQNTLVEVWNAVATRSHDSAARAHQMINDEGWLVLLNYHMLD